MMRSTWIRSYLPCALALVASACRGPISDDGDPPPDGPRFAEVAPIFAEHCTSCHDDGGAAPFSMRTHAEIAAWAESIATAVGERTMPPWGVDDSGACQTFVAARWLTDDEIDAITDWIAAGAPAGEAGDEALLEPPARDRISESALVVAMPEPYVADASMPDDYRCFVLDPQLADDRFLTAYEVRPGHVAGVHHVLLYATVDDDGDAQAIDLDDASEGPGYPCFGGPGIDGFRFLAGWAPGTGVTRYPDGTGIRVSAGHRLVMQVHYNRGVDVAPDRTEVALDLADTIAAEAEVSALADLELSLAPGLAEVSTTTSMTVEDFGTATILGVYPHMHKLGRQLHVELDHAGATSCLVDVPQWNFEQQQFYFYEQPLTVGDGDTTRLTCTYDTTTRNTDVVWGEGTADEMCLAGFYFVRG